MLDICRSEVTFRSTPRVLQREGCGRAAWVASDTVTLTVPVQTATCVYKTPDMYQVYVSYDTTGIRHLICIIYYHVWSGMSRVCYTMQCEYTLYNIKDSSQNATLEKITLKVFD